MSGKIVNLRQVRKGKARAEAEEKAASNRAKFGRSKAEKAREAADAATRSQEAERLEAHRIKPVDHVPDD